MNDYISREEAKKAVVKAIGQGYSPFNAIVMIPAADVRPVVLCRDCEYCRKVDEFEHWCYGFCSPARLVRKDDFCSYGKKNEEDET